jgi:hypothetical protein
VASTIVKWTVKIRADGAKFQQTGSSTTLAQLRTIGKRLSTDAKGAYAALAPKKPVSAGVLKAKAEALRSFRMFSGSGNEIVLAVAAASAGNRAAVASHSATAVKLSKTGSKLLTQALKDLRGSAGAA